MLLVYEEVVHRCRQEPFALLHLSMSLDQSEMRAMVFRESETTLKKMYEHEFDLKTRKCINTEHTLLYHDHFLWTLPMTTTPITEFRINRGLKQTASVNITILMAFVTSTGTKHVEVRGRMIEETRQNEWCDQKNSKHHVHHHKHANVSFNIKKIFTTAPFVGGSQVTASFFHAPKRQ